MSNIAVLGEKEYIYGFRFLGMKCFYVDSEEKARASLEEVFSGDYPVIFMLERWTEILKKELAELAGRPAPIVVPIKDNLMDYGLIQERLRQASLAASGVDLTKRG